MQKEQELIERLRVFKDVPITQDVLTGLLNEYHAVANKIALLVRDGVLLRIKHGLYCVAPRFSGVMLNPYLISNHLYGPSYVSFESALSFYGIIPERVATVSGVVALSRGRKMRTSVGQFNYYSVAEDYFSVGLETRRVEGLSDFLIATREKALCDMVMRTSGLRTVSAHGMRRYLEEELRCDFDVLRNLDLAVFDVCARAGHKSSQIMALKKAVSL